MMFDEPSLFKTVPNLIRTLIRNNFENAKDYLRNRGLKLAHPKASLFPSFESLPSEDSET